MNINDLKKKAPVMPDSFHRMLEETVSHQLDEAQHPVRLSPHPRHIHLTRRAAIVLIAAVLLIPTLVYAGYRIFFRASLTSEGSYGAKLSYSQEEGSEFEVPEILPKVAVTVSEVPEGFTWSNPSHLDKKDDDQTFSFCFASVLMDEASLDTSRVEFFVTDKELLTLGEHEAVYLNTQSIRRASYSQYIYISYPEYQRILIIYGTDNITEETFLELARNTSLTPTGEEIQSKDLPTWKDYTARANHSNRSYESHKDQAEITSVSPSFDPISRTSRIGETITPLYSPVEITLISVQIEDDIRLIDSSFFYHRDISSFVDEDGVLLPVDIDYIWYGNGVDSLDTIVDTVTVPRKLVYMTVDFTNTSDEAVERYVFYPQLMFWMGVQKAPLSSGNQSLPSNHLYTEEKDRYVGVYYDHEDLTAVAYDATVTSSEIPTKTSANMFCFDVYDESSNGRNDIPYLAPGETVTVHIAWIVTEDQLPYMLVNFDHSMSQTYDIRQQP
ncbi:MAG: hypothetical protein J5589_05570 [Firmicutes bacterium]|nr:hypothetical protein [Bacillota bacterium]